MATQPGTARLRFDSSTDERDGRSETMNPILMQHLAQHKIDTFEREAAAERLAALARRSTVGAPAHAGPVTRTVARIRLALHTSAA
jgi:hypothetical protein